MGQTTRRWLPLPLSFFLGAIAAVLLAARGGDPAGSRFRWTATAIEAGVLVLCIAAIDGIGWRLGGPPEPPGAGESGPPPAQP